MENQISSSFEEGNEEALPESNGLAMIKPPQSIVYPHRAIIAYSK